MVVLEAEDLFADGELSEVEGHLVWSEPVGCGHAPPGQPVELGNGLPSGGEHQGVGVVLSGGPPAFDHVARRGGVWTVSMRRGASCGLAS